MIVTLFGSKLKCAFITKPQWKPDTIPNIRLTNSDNDNIFVNIERNKDETNSGTQEATSNSGKPNGTSRTKFIVY